MAQTISLLRILARDSREPAGVLNSLNQHLKPILKGRFVTGQYLVVHARENYWEGSCAGHLPLLALKPDQNFAEELLAASGPPLGLADQASYTAVKREFKPGDKIFMYTDGWTESRNRKGQEFGLQRLKEILLNSRAKNPDIILADLESGQKAFTENSPQYDDLTAVLLEFPGK
jgi:sigma-B regulation protein RsbU (phosphoserine phosphatase)